MDAKVKEKCLDTQAEYDPAESSTEDHFNGTPGFPRQHIQVASEGDTGEQVGEEDIYGRSYDELIKQGPVGNVSTSKVG